MQNIVIAGIIDIINSAFSEFRDYNPYAANSVSADEVGTVYERRLSTLKNWMNSGEETYTEEEQKFPIQQYEKLKTPFILNTRMDGQLFYKISQHLF